jgi:hypothetical protein
MRRITILILILASVYARGQQGIVHGSGDPRLRGNESECAGMFYVDDINHTRYVSASSSPCVWTPVGGGVPVGGLTYYASQYPGQANNSIVSTFADSAKCGASGCTVIADPSYSTVEQPYNFSAGRFPLSSIAHFEDRRGGGLLNLYRNTPTNTYTSQGDANVTGCVFDALTVVSGQSRNTCNPILLWSSGPGMDHGTPGKGPGGWSTEHGLSILTTINSPGISNPFSVYQTKAGIGDAAIYTYMYGYGGAIAGSDEGQQNLAIGGGEWGNTFTGTITTGGTGATSIKVTCTADCNLQGDGRYLVDLTRGTAGNATASAQPSGSFTPGSYTTDITVPVSTFWGTLSTDVVTPVGSPLGTGSTAMTFSVASGSGNVGAPVAGDLVCFAGQFHEQAKITSVTGSGPWSITLPLRHAHEANSWIMANGVCGSFIDFVANDIAGNGSQTLHYPVDLIGSTDANTVRYRYFDRAGPTNNNLGNVRFAQAFSGGASFVTNTAGIVNFHSAQVLSNNPVYFGQPVITISNASDPAFNGPCTSTFADASGFLNCTQAASTGLTSNSATVSIGSTVYGNTAFNLVPGAEVLDVLDYNSTNCAGVSRTTPCIDGTFTLEPNNVAWTASDSVENSHHYSAQFNGLKDVLSVYNPIAGAGNGAEILSLLGPGLGGPGSVAKRILNLQGNSSFVSHGGVRTPPGGIALDLGLFNYGLFMRNAPDPAGSSFLSSGCPVSGCTDQAYSYNIWSFSGNGGNASQTYFPYSRGLATAAGYMDLSQTPLLGPIVRGRPASPNGGSYNSLASTLVFKSTDGSSVDHTVTLSAASTLAVNETFNFPVYPSGTINKTLATTDVFVASGASHSSGLVPDTSSSAGTTKYLREDATWQVPPSPAVFVGSGASHSTGLVPDPGASAGTTKFLREDGTWQAPAGSGGAPIVAQAALTGQTAAINPVVTFTPSTDGTFRFSAFFIITTGCTSGNLNVLGAFTPISGHAQQTSTGVSCTTAYNYTNYSLVFHGAAGIAQFIYTQFTATAGPVVYNIDATIEQLQ